LTMLPILTSNGKETTSSHRVAHGASINKNQIHERSQLMADVDGSI
jgi:hypothetical protein